MFSFEISWYLNIDNLLRLFLNLDLESGKSYTLHTVLRHHQRFENWAFNADHKGKVEMLMHVNSPEEPRRR